jgi:anti-sigma-K factor RskA
MHIPTYLESGIIERYALGLSTTEENRELLRLAALHPEIKAELDAVNESLETYAREHAKVPPPSVKEALMKSIHQQTGGASSERGKIISINEIAPDDKNATPLFRYAAAVFIALLAISILLNVVLYKNLKTSEKNLVLLSNEKNRVAVCFEAQKASYNSAMKDLSILKNPEMVRMEMKGTAPEAKALVYCNFRTNEIFLDVKTLPAPPDSMQYQFWAIVKGKPVDAGMIELCPPNDTCGIHKMNPIPDAHAFAISLEKKGGKPQPAGQIYASFGI